MVDIYLDQESIPTKVDRERKISYTGLGVILGASLGVLFGLLFVDDSFAFVIGIGITLGLIIGSIMDVHSSNS